MAKILYHHRTASRDGQSVHIDEMIKAMRKLGHEVRVVAPAIASEEAGETSGAIAWAKRNIPAPVYELMEFAYSIPAFFRLWRAAREFRPDFLYERYNLFLMSGLWLKRLTGLPMLLEVNAPLTEERVAHGNLSLKRFAALCDRVVWRGADHVLPVSDVLADYVRAAGVPEDRIKVIPNGVNRDEFPASLRESCDRALHGVTGKIVLGFAGYIRDWHGLDRVVDLLPENPDLVLLVAGDGPGRKGVEDRAAGLGVAPQVIFKGFVSRAEMPGIVAAFDIALQPAVVDYASPLKMFEYMALGCAIVAPDQPNIRELLVHGETALLFKADDDDARLAAIRRLVDDRALRERLGASASEAIEARGYAWEGNARKVLDLARGIRR